MIDINVVLQLLTSVILIVPVRPTHSLSNTKVANTNAK